MVTRPQRTLGLRKRITPRVKVWLEIDGRYIFGFGLSEILKAVQATGSIKDGAERIGKSYRYAWGRIKKAEDALGVRLVATRVGGRETARSSLTPQAEELVANFDALRKRAFSVIEREFR
jgi:molybdate transport system regulatory protein